MLMQQYLYNIHRLQLHLENSNKDRIKLYPHNGVGKVVYSPAVNNVCDPTWVILECDKELVAYYKWFLEKKGVKLDSLMWGSHISVVRGGTFDEIPSNFKDNWGYNDGQLIEFNYGDLVTNNTHWWLEVQSQELETMRSNLGLKPHPDFGFHVTIGKISNYSYK